MPGLDHLSHDCHDDVHSPEKSARNARWGLVLFAVYLLLYGAFVLTNAFAPEVMEQAPLAGVSLSILAGFGLIVAAFVLALVYGWVCRENGGSVGRSEDRGA